ncbi:hypothetical protein AB0D30_26050 [Streptomyces sp. NPDC048409]|uniref:hypothetical protein n=1 Tax=Streptomyces sp. NPDC048409 TaxID=3154723 RepID=UPI003435629C
MLAQLLAVAAVLAAIVVPFAVEWFKGTRWKDEQNRVIGVNAWAEQVTLPSTPPGYCHLQYVVRNGSNNDITDVAVVPPGRDKLRFMPVVHAATQESEIDPNLRQLDPSFNDYPIEVLFTDNWNLHWHQHRELERVKVVNSNPRTIRDYAPHPRNPRGMSKVRREALLVFAGCTVAALLAYGIAASNIANPKNSNIPSKKSATPNATEAGSR